LQSDRSSSLSFRGFAIFMVGVTWSAVFLASYVQKQATYYVASPVDYQLVFLPFLVIPSAIVLAIMALRTFINFRLNTRNMIIILSSISLLSSIILRQQYPRNINRFQLVIFSSTLVVLGLFLFLWTRHYRDVVIQLPQYMQNWWHQRLIVLTWVRYDLESKYIDSFLGLLWIILEPMMMALVYSFAFSSILGIRSSERSDLPAGLFVFCSIIIWRIFSQSLNHGSNFIISKRGLVTQLPVPLDVLGIIVMLRLLVDYAVSFLVVICMIHLFGLTIHPVYIWIPLILAIIFIFATGLTFLLGSISVYIRDVPYLVSRAVRLLFYISPILYEIERVPREWQLLFQLNPFGLLIANLRNIILYHDIPNYGELVYAAMCGILSFYIGYVFFKHHEQDFGDLL
jgi:lipopolysaccharide transport system permease protein